MSATLGQVEAVEMARNFGFKFIQDSSTNLLHLSVNGKTATCNSRYIGWTTDGNGADFACARCHAKLIKMQKAGA